MCMLNLGVTQAMKLLKDRKVPPCSIFLGVIQLNFLHGIWVSSTIITLACDEFSRKFIQFNPKQEALSAISSCWSMYNLCTRIWNPTRGNVKKWSSADVIVYYAAYSWLLYSLDSCLGIASHIKASDCRVHVTSLWSVDKSIINLHMLNLDWKT